jgi:acyl carrier protein
VSSIETEIEQFIVREFLRKKNRLQVGHDEALLESGIMDSVALLRLIGFLEERFQVAVRDGDLVPENFRTINAIKAFVEQRRPV